MVIVKVMDAQYSTARGSCDIVYTPCAVTDGKKVWAEDLEDGCEELERFFEDERQYQYDHIDIYESAGIDVTKLREAMQKQSAL